MKHLTTIGLALLFSTAGAQFVVQPTSAKISTRVIAAKADEICRRFMAAASVRVMGRAGHLVLSEEAPGVHLWRAQYYDLSRKVPGILVVHVDADRPQVVYFANLAKADVQSSMNRKKPSRFRTSDQAKAYVTALGSRLGLGGGWYLRDFASFLDRDPRLADANPSGSIEAQFSYRPNGYPFINAANNVGISLDPLDGELMYFKRQENLIPLPPQIKLTKAQAVEIARSRLKDFIAQHPGVFSDAVTPTALKGARVETLGYVSPNDRYGSGVKPSVARQITVKLAYAVRIGKCLLFVDAAGGALLGGNRPK